MIEKIKEILSEIVKNFHELNLGERFKNLKLVKKLKNLNLSKKFKEIKLVKKQYKPEGIEKKANSPDQELKNEDATEEKQIGQEDESVESKEKDLGQEEVEKTNIGNEEDMEGIYEVTYNLRASDIFKFMLYHSFSNILGYITLIFSIGALISFPYFAFVKKDSSISIILLILIFMYLIASPLNMYYNSKKQVLYNPVFKNKMAMQLKDKNILVKQYTGDVSFEWSKFKKIINNRFQYLFYVNKNQAFILPKDIIEEDYKAVIEELINKKIEEMKKEAKDA